MNEEIVKLLEKQKMLLIAVSTGGPRIQEKETEYVERRQRIQDSLHALGLDDPLPFGDLWQWYGKWSDGSLPSYQSRRQYIADLVQPVIDALRAGYIKAKPAPVLPEEIVVPKPALDIFISHSGADVHLAGSLARLLRNAFSLSPDRIRCTSVDGFRLEVGTDTNERLRVEVRESTAFIALLTRNSLASTYVLFEMGARWGAGQYFAPVLAGGLATSELKAPVSGLTVLDLTSRGQVAQFLDNLAETLGVRMVSRAAFETELSDLVVACSEPIHDPLKPPFSIVSARWGAPGSEVDVTDALRSQIRDGRLAAQAYGPSLVSDDVAYGRPKRLLVEYAVGKLKKTVVIPEGAAECLP